jgi:hypothetical protein
MQTRYFHTNYIYFYVWEIYSMYAKRHIRVQYEKLTAQIKTLYTYITKMQRREQISNLAQKSELHVHSRRIQHLTGFRYYLSSYSYGYSSSESCK